jgi:hypothetical protein
MSFHVIDQSGSGKDASGSSHTTTTDCVSDGTLAHSIVGGVPAPSTVHEIGSLAWEANAGLFTVISGVV